MTTTFVLRRLATTAFLLILVLAPTGTPSAGAQERAPSGVVPGLPVPDGPGEVHSWALSPAGAGNGSQPGDRADLSYEMAPGTGLDDAVTLFNLSNVTMTFDLYATDARNNADGAFAPLGAGEKPTGAGSWVTLDVGRVTIPARQQTTIPLRIEVPAGARPGDHSGAILATSAVRGTGADGKVITLDRRTGTRLYIRVDGPLSPELAVTKLRTTYDPSLSPADGTARISYRIENRGNMRLSGVHKVSVAGPLGLLRTSGRTIEMPELLPGESIDVRQTLEGVAATGIAFTEVDLQPVPVGGDPGDLDPADRRSLAFAIPFTLVALGLMAALAAYALRAYRRHETHPAIRRGAA